MPSDEQHRDADNVLVVPETTTHEPLPAGGAFGLTRYGKLTGDVQNGGERWCNRPAKR